MDTEIVLKSLPLTHNLTLEVVANLDKGALPVSGSKLPQDKFCVFVRVVSQSMENRTEIYDLDWRGIEATTDDFSAFRATDWADFANNFVVP